MKPQTVNYRQPPSKLHTPAKKEPRFNGKIQSSHDVLTTNQVSSQKPVSGGTKKIVADLLLNIVIAGSMFWRESIYGHDLMLLFCRFFKLKRKTNGIKTETSRLPN